MRHPAVVLCALGLAVACDRAPQPADTPVVPQADLNGATVLFRVFGPRETPRIAPIAIVRGSVIEAINLNADGWRNFDATIFAAGARIPVYHHGVAVGTVEVTRGMWPADSAALYTVTDCREIVPHALGRLEATEPLEETVELLGASLPLPQMSDPRPAPANPEGLGRTLAGAIATGAGIGAEDLTGLDFQARWLRSGVGTSGHTLFTSYIDPNAGDLGPGAGTTAVILVMAEDSAGTLQTTYTHALSGESRTLEFQRLVNYADLNGDGVAEMILEAWRYAGIPSLAVLTRQPGAWTETFRVGLDWCVGR